MSIELLRKVGMYVDEAFLCPEICLTLRAEMQASSHVKAGIFNNEGETCHDDDKRQSLFAKIKKPLNGRIRERIVALKPTLEAHFSESYSDTIEEPKYLIYNKNHFFSPHRDDQIGRKLNLSIYLNDEVDDANTEPDCYSGGALKIYGLLKASGMEKWGVSLRGQTGLLIAYPADAVHEVTPIIEGTRYAIVARYMEPSK